MTETPRLGDLIDVIKHRHPDDDPLGQLADAVLLGDHLGELADQLIGHFVDNARHRGASWSEIGRSMGVTKQAAQKRFVAKGAAGSAPSLSTFARYTDAARRAVVQAQEEARQARHPYIGPEHVLLGVLHEPGTPATQAVEALGVSVDQVRAAVLGPPGGAGASGASGAAGASGASGGQIPFSPPGKTALELGHEVADHLGSEPVGPEHMLLGVLALPAEEPVVAALAGLGVTRLRVLPEVLRQAGRAEPPPGPVAH